MKGLFHFRFPQPLPILLLILLGGMVTSASAKPAKLRDISDTIAANPIMTKFAAMLQASPDLQTFLSSRGPFTVFVPSDSAFSKMPQGTIDALLAPQNKERLQHIILYHVVNGHRLYAHDLLIIISLLSCEGSQLPIKKNKQGTQFVGNAKIIHGDIKCENGIIHMIDSLLVPTGPSMPPLVPSAVVLPPADASSASTNAPSETVPATTTNAAPVDP